MSSVNIKLCSTVYIRNKTGQFLLLDHKKLKKWLPPGGKVDSGETPEQAAIREVFEETGLHVNLMGSRLNVEGGQFHPLGMQMNVLSKDTQHLDILYLAEPVDENAVLTIAEREANGLEWFTLDEVRKLNTFKSVIQICERLSSANQFVPVLDKQIHGA